MAVHYDDLEHLLDEMTKPAAADTEITIIKDGHGKRAFRLKRDGIAHNGLPIFKCGRERFTATRVAAIDPDRDLIYFKATQYGRRG